MLQCRAELNCYFEGKDRIQGSYYTRKIGIKNRSPVALRSRNGGPANLTALKPSRLS